MNETKRRKMTQRASALLLTGIMCVSAFAGNASAQGKKEPNKELKEKPAISAVSKPADQAATNSAAAATPSQLVEVLPGKSVSMTVHLNEGTDKNNAGEASKTASIDVEIMDKESSKAAAKDKKADSAKEEVNKEQVKYFWQVDRKNGKGWKDLLWGANGDNYLLKKVTAKQNGWEYRCVITDAKGTIESSSVVLQVGDPAVKTDSADNSKKP